MGRVRVVSTANSGRWRRSTVGIDPVSLALRPDGTELWVANHVSDSVSVISLVPGASQHKVVETIQSVDAANLITDFDEPVGIAFASNDKAYVALSSRNRIAIVDANSYAVTGFLAINAQEPRAMRVRNGLLFVPAFESGNRSELSSCVGAPDPDDPQCTFDFTAGELRAEPAAGRLRRGHREGSRRCPTATCSSSTPRRTRRSTWSKASARCSTASP